jgi:hypothetical protein
MVKTFVNTDSQVAAHILLDGAQEILGMELIQKVIERAGLEHISAVHGSRPNLSFAQVNLFMRALEEMCGETGSHGLALRIGRAAFQYGLKQYGDQAGFRSMEYRLLPTPRRLESGLHSLAKIVARECGSKITVSDEGAFWQWQMGRQAAAQDCFLIAGLLREFTSWAGGGRFYRVVETECQVWGNPACTFRVEKRPLD